jgi:hypothetical protein
LIHDKGFITKKDQDIYLSEYFYNMIGHLIRKKFVKALKDYEQHHNQYFLDERG